MLQQSLPVSLLAVELRDYPTDVRSIPFHQMRPWQGHARQGLRDIVRFLPDANIDEMKIHTF